MKLFRLISLLILIFIDRSKQLQFIYLCIMKRFNQSRKVKEPVRLRMKALANGNKSLYLDTYHKGKRVYEFLRLYLIPEKTAADKEINASIMRAATAIKATRILAFVNGKAEIRNHDSNISLQEWIEHIIKVKTGQRSVSSIKLMKRLMKHIKNCRPSALLADVDREFCVGFANYLRSAHALNSAKPLMPSTQFELLNALSIILNEAVRAELISSNPMKLLNSAERIKKPDSNREFLTPEEVKSIIALAADNIAAGDDVAAFIFCCFCGLRYSDVSRLKWDNIVDTDKGKIVTVIMKKTHRLVEIPISKKASSFLPSPICDNSTTKVFTFPRYGVTLKRLKEIAKAAGIKKKITFHVARHTFATMMLTAGADLYTISKLIGHSDIRTTQIYSKVVDEKKHKAITLLDKLF